MNRTLNLFAFLLAGVFALLPFLAFSEQIFTRGIVTARIIGPNESTPETATKRRFETNEVIYFWTTIKVIKADKNFGKELEGKSLMLMTGYFDKKLIGKTRPLQLYCVQEKGGEKNYRLECTE